MKFSDQRRLQEHFKGREGGDQLVILVKPVISSKSFELLEREKSPALQVSLGWLESALQLVASPLSRTMILTRCVKIFGYRM